MAAENTDALAPLYATGTNLHPCIQRLIWKVRGLEPGRKLIATPLCATAALGGHQGGER